MIFPTGERKNGLSKKNPRQRPFSLSRMGKSYLAGVENWGSLICVPFALRDSNIFEGLMFLGHTLSSSGTFQTPEKFRKAPGNALKAFPGIPLESTAGIPPDPITQGI